MLYRMMRNLLYNNKSKQWSLGISSAWALTARTANMATRDAMEELLQCMICFESYRNPKMLRCAHTFCADCLIGYQKSYDQQSRAVPGKVK